MSSSFSDTLEQDINVLLEQMANKPKKKVVQKKVESTPQVRQENPVLTEDYSYINNLADKISELDESGFHYHDQQTVDTLDSTVDMTDRFIAAIKRDENIEELTPLDEYTEKRFAALTRQITSVSNTVNSFSESTIVAGIGHGPFGQAPGGGAARIVDQDDTNIDADALVGGEVLVWDGQYWTPTFVSGVGGDVTGILEGDGIEVSSTLAGGKGQVTISVDPVVLNNISDNTSDILTLQGEVTQLENDYTSLEIKVDKNIVDIIQLDDDIAALEIKVDKNTGDITDLNAAVAKKPDMTAKDTAPTPPAKDGQFWFDISSNKLYVSNSTAWEEVSGSAGGATVLNDLTDVTIGTEASGQVIKYTGAEYENAYLKTNELDLTNPTRLVNLISRLNRNITPPTNLTSQEDANQLFGSILDDLDDQVLDSQLDINTLQGNVTQLDADLTALEVKVTKNTGDITDLNAAVAKKPDMTAQATAPTPPPKDGQFWFDINTDKLYISKSNVWEEVSGDGGGSSVIIATLEPDPTDLDKGSLWVNDDYQLFVLESDGGTWERVGRDEYKLDPITLGTGVTAIRLREEVTPAIDQFVEIVGDGDIEVKVEGGKIVVDGSLLKGRVFLGYLDPTSDDLTSLDPSPPDNAYYEFNADGDWLNVTPVQAGDEIYWDGTQWVVNASSVATLDKVLKAGNESPEDFKVNKGTFESGIINLNGVDIEDVTTHLTYGVEVILTDKNIGLHELDTDKLDFKGNILEVTDTELLLNGNPIKGSGGGGGVLTHYLDDLYDVETFENTFEAIYNISKDKGDEGGVDTDDTTGEITFNPVDENSKDSSDFFSNTAIGTRHYLWDDDRKMSGVGTVLTVSNDTDGNFVFTYYEPDFLTKIAAAKNSFRISVADYTDLQDGSYLSWSTGGALWKAHKPTHPVTVSDTAPLDSVVEEGDLWFNTMNGNLYVRHKDNDSEQWVIAVTPVSPDMSDIELRLQALEQSSLSLVMSPTPPTTPSTKDGDLWVDETDMSMFIYEATQWIQLTTPVTPVTTFTLNN